MILPFIKLLTWKPILFDMYIATYDTMIFDRGAAKDRSLKSRFYKLSDVLSCRLSRNLVLETEDHIRDFAKKFHVSEKKFARVFLAVDDTVIYPRTVQQNSDRFLVHFHGEYAPFHGVKFILQAAQLLKDVPIDFQIIGKGITYDEDMRLATELGLTNVRFIDPVPYEELAHYMARADVCLGIFGDNERMLRVLTNKVIEAIGMGKPLITGRNAPVQELLQHGESVYLVNRGDAKSLADGILELKQNNELRQKIAQGGYAVFQQHCTMNKLGLGFSKIIEDMQNHGH